MDLTPGRQRLLFVVIVIVLAGLGIFLVRSHNSGSGTPAAQGTPTPATSSPGTNAGTSTGASTGAADTPPATVPAATPVSTVGGAEIYQWLPFTPAELNAAAQTTVAFAKDYATWSYTETKTAYAAKLTGLVTAQEQATLAYDYSTAGVSTLRVASKQVSTGSGAIDSIQSFGSGTSTVPVSITFLVTINQQVASTEPTKTTNGQYTVTVEAAGNAWQVSDIELSGLGNQ